MESPMYRKLVIMLTWNLQNFPKCHHHNQWNSHFLLCCEHLRTFLNKTRVYFSVLRGFGSHCSLGAPHKEPSCEEGINRSTKMSWAADQQAKLQPKDWVWSSHRKWKPHCHLRCLFRGKCHRWIKSCSPYHVWAKPFEAANVTRYFRFLMFTCVSQIASFSGSRQFLFMFIDKMYQTL